MEPRRRLRLTEEEAARIRALCFACLLCLLPGAARFIPSSDAPQPMPNCTEAPRQIEGARVCGAQEGQEYSQLERLWLGDLLDLNQVDAQSLAIVPGIGEKLAARILKDREGRGPFTSVEDVERVKGIGPKLRARIARYARVR